MDQTAIIRLIKTILPSVSDPEGIGQYDPESADFQLPRNHEAAVAADALSKLTAELRKTNEFARLEGGILHNSPGSDSGPIKVEDFSQWLLAQSRFRAPEDCLADLLAAIRKNSSPVFEIVAIWGISPKRRFNLGNGLELVPIEDLPPSLLKDLLTGKKRHNFSFDVANSSPRPGAAIVLETEDGPIYEPPESEAAKKSERSSRLQLAVLIGATEAAKRDALKQLATMMDPLKATRETRSISFLAGELATVIALLTPKPIFTLAHWYQRPPATPLVGLLDGWSGPTNEHPFYNPIAKQDYPIDEITALVRQYQSLGDAARRRLRTPLARLNQSRRNLDHHTVEAGAIDLGIAMEALLTLDRDHNAPISYLLRARGTLLLGGTSEIRRQNYNALKEAYDLRSQVVHNGVIVNRADIPFSEEARRKLAEAHEQVRAGQAVCAQLLLALIRRGEFPDWDALTLGI